MDNLLIYLLKVTACTVVLYVSYQLFFGRDTFSARNRFLILGMVVTSLLLPLITISPAILTQDSGVALNRIGEIVISGSNLQTDASEKIAGFDYIYLLYIIYISVALFFSTRLAYGIFSTMRIINRGRLADAGFPKIITSEEDCPPFSFFPYIVLPASLLKQEGYNEILKHERIHIEQRHTFDLLFMQIVTSLLWFNPFIWMFRKSMVLTHEYIADSKVPGESIPAKEYQYKLLNTVTGSYNIPVAHNYSNFIKKRIIMMNTKPSKNLAALKNLMLLPLAALLILLFSCRTAMHSGEIKKLSDVSASEITKYLASKIIYPQDAKNASAEATIYLTVEVKRGVVKEIKATKNNDEEDSQLLQQIVVVAYAKNMNTGKIAGKETISLENECLRVGKLVTDIQIPEWKKREVEFTIPVIFQLR